MRPPLTKRPQPQPTIPPATPTTTTDTRGEALQEKAALARHLHEQGIDPTRWTQAHPAPQSEQQLYRDTGIKPRDNRFDANGKLYNLSPAVTATAEQAKAIADAYIADRTGKDDTVKLGAKIEDLVDIAKVPLKHPLGTPHNQRPANDMNAAAERAALVRHYGQSGVDPDKAHLGDPLEMKDQERLKAEIEKTLPGDKSEISGLPIFYQGYDDGWIYQANEHTRASSTNAQASDHPAAANENTTSQSQVDASPDKLADRPASPLPKIPSGIDRARAEYKSAVKGLPKIVKLIDDLKAGKPLSEDQVALNAGIVASLKRAGIKFDYQKVDVDQLRAHAAGEEKYLRSIDLTDPAAIQAAVTLLSLQTSEALAGGRFNTVRLQQAGSILERLKLVPELYASLGSSVLGRTTAMKTSTALLSAEAAEDGPVDYDAALKEMTGWLSHAGIIGSKTTEATTSELAGTKGEMQQKQILPASPETLKSLSAGLADASSIEIIIGGVPLFKQGEHKTLMDEIFITEFVKIAREKGCLPGPGDDRKWDSHGGSKPQKRITDVDQTGHQGSGQPDGWVRWENIDRTWTEVFWNSTTTLVNGFTDVVREVKAMANILSNADKQLAMGTKNMEAFEARTDYPVRGKSNSLRMGAKPNWSEAELREYISKKLRDFFEKNFKNCKFIGEVRDQKLDFPDDPDLPPTPPR